MRLAYLPSNNSFQNWQESEGSGILYIFPKCEENVILVEKSRTVTKLDLIIGIGSKARSSNLLLHRDMPYL